MKPSQPLSFQLSAVVATRSDAMPCHVVSLSLWTRVPYPLLDSSPLKEKKARRPSHTASPHQFPSCSTSATPHYNCSYPPTHPLKLLGRSSAKPWFKSARWQGRCG